MVSAAEHREAETRNREEGFSKKVTFEQILEEDKMGPVAVSGKTTERH